MKLLSSVFLVLTLILLTGIPLLAGTTVIEGVTNAPGTIHSVTGVDNLDGSYKVHSGHILIPSIDAGLLPEPDDPSSGDVNPFTGEPLSVKEKNEGDNIAYYYSQDAGTSWTYGGPIGQSSDDENMPTLRSSKTYGSVTVAYNQDPGDSTMFSWSSYSDPSSFTAPVKVNDYNATGYWPPTAGWLHNGYSWYSAVLYAAWREGYAIYLDWYSNDGVEEDDIDCNVRFISVTGTYANPGIVYRVITPGRVKITLHDVSGRLISKLVDGEKRSGSYTVELDNGLSSGVYFVKMSSQVGTFARKVNVLQ